MRSRPKLSMLIGIYCIVAATTVDAAELTFAPVSQSRMVTNVDSLFDLRWKNVARQGYDISCGSAALATILNHQFGDEVGEDELIDEILERIKQKDVKRRGGFTLLDIKKVAMARGYTVNGYQLSLEQLNRLDPPALVPLTIRAYKHFVVFRGMADGKVFLADPSFGNIVIPDYEFDKMWREIILVIDKQEKNQFPGELTVKTRPVSVSDAPGALRDFIYRPDAFQMIRPDEL